MFRCCTEPPNKDNGTKPQATMIVPSMKSIAKCAGKDFRDGAVVPFE